MKLIQCRASPRNASTKLVKQLSSDFVELLLSNQLKAAVQRVLNSDNTALHGVSHQNDATTAGGTLGRGTRGRGQGLITDLGSDLMGSNRQRSATVRGACNNDGDRGD